MKGRVYKITNTITSKLYVGSTTAPLCNRMALHRTQARHYTHMKCKMLVHMRTHGVENFTIHLLEEKTVASVDELHQLEEKWIEQLDTLNNGLNSCKAFRAGRTQRRERLDLITEIKEAEEHLKKLYKQCRKEGSKYNFQFRHKLEEEEEAIENMAPEVDRAALREEKLKKLDVIGRKLQKKGIRITNEKMRKVSKLGSRVVNEWHKKYMEKELDSDSDSDSS